MSDWLTLLIVLGAAFGFGGPLALLLLIAEWDDAQRRKERWRRSA